MKKVINSSLNAFIVFLFILLACSLFMNFQTSFLGKDYNNLFGYSFFEIETASMSGTIEIGDWIVVKVTDDVTVNDIVTYKENDSFITHRVVQQYEDTFITRGDSNNTNDNPIQRDVIIGKVVKILPKFGIIKKVILNPTVLILFILLLFVGISFFDENSFEKELIDKILNYLKEKYPFLEKIFEEEKVREDKKTDKDKIVVKKVKLTKKEKEVKRKEEEKELENVKERFKNVGDGEQTILLSKVVVDINNKSFDDIDKDEDK